MSVARLAGPPSLLNRQGAARLQNTCRTAKAEGNINRLRTDVLREFEQAVRLNGFHHDLAQEYVSRAIPDDIKELTQTLAGKGKTVVLSETLYPEGFPS